MKSSDAYLLRKMVEQRQKELAPELKPEEYFNWFVADQVLKIHDPSTDDIKAGLVDGPDDGGVDGFYILAGNAFISEDPDFTESKRFLPNGLTIDVIIFQAKLEESFRERPLDLLLNTVPRLLDLKRPLGRVSQLYNERLRDAAKRFRDTVDQLSRLCPQISVRVHYATLGSGPNRKVLGKAKDLEEELLRLFPSRQRTSVRLLGAKELLELARMREPSQSELCCTDLLILEDGAVVALATLHEFYRFITDENGEFRHSLFEANVRDYQGKTSVNSEIRRTLIERPEEDFWWLNNGITVVAERVMPTGKKLTLQDPQIVNGLQTSWEIFEYFRADVPEDKRKILVRIVTPKRPESRDRIIKATNSQTTLPAASLRATDEIQWKIEQFLSTCGWFYERRKNFYKNQGKPLNSIVSISELGQAVMAVVLQEPGAARARPSSLLNRDDDYRRVFDERFSIEVYRIAIELVRLVEERLRAAGSFKPEDVVNMKFYVAMAIAALACRQRTPSPEKIANLRRDEIKDELVSKAIGLVEPLYKELGGNSVVAKGSELGKRLKEKLSEVLG